MPKPSDNPYDTATSFVPSVNARPPRPKAVSFALAAQILSIVFSGFLVKVSRAQAIPPYVIVIAFVLFCSVFLAAALLAWKGFRSGAVALLMLQAMHAPFRLLLLLRQFARHPEIAWPNLAVVTFAVLAVALLWVGSSRTWFKDVRAWREERN